MLQLTHAQAVVPAALGHRLPLRNVAATRQLELTLQRTLGAHALMQRAGLALARLALAIAPHADSIWVACGPGNNGGDGMEAAMWLQRWGKRAVITLTGDATRLPADAAASWQRARAAGVSFANEWPPLGPEDLVIDALLGIGAHRPPQGVMREWLNAIAETPASVLCVDVPTGMNADTGEPLDGQTAWWRMHPANRRHTLSLLSLKPGLFTAQGRDASGAIWFEPLDGPDGVPIASSHEPIGAAEVSAPTAWLNGESAVSSAPHTSYKGSQRLHASHKGSDLPHASHKGSDLPHASHKGSRGDVVVLGGAAGMTGAAVLAATAALHAGAGRVWWHALQTSPDTPAPHSLAADIMVRQAGDAHTRIDARATVVCGCGGGDAIAPFIEPLLTSHASLVLDADALNAIAADTRLQRALSDRHTRGLPPAVITPHPLEAARLLSITTAQVQSDRLLAAQRLADGFGCVVVLKGSGTVIAAPAQAPVINPTGNARLAIAGTGDVLAGLIGARLARPASESHEDARTLDAVALAQAALANIHARVCAAVWDHGMAAERAEASPLWADAASADRTLTASDLARLLTSRN